MTMNAELHTPTAPALATPSPNQVSYTVTVIPDGSGGATFLYNGEPGPFTINVQENEAIETQFILDPSSGEYVEQPVNWFTRPLAKGGQPIPQPSAMEVTLLAPSSVTIRADNSKPGSPGSYHFTLSVLLGAKVYTSPDPTIINNPIGG
jgi:hypothetical protein